MQGYSKIDKTKNFCPVSILFSKPVIGG